MLATIFLGIFVALPLSLTLGQMFRRPAALVAEEERLPRWSMQDFKPRS
jgi:hypothetical protein